MHFICSRQPWSVLAPLLPHPHPAIRAVTIATTSMDTALASLGLPPTCMLSMGPPQSLVSVVMMMMMITIIMTLIGTIWDSTLVYPVMVLLFILWWYSCLSCDDTLVYPAMILLFMLNRDWHLPLLLWQCHYLFSTEMGSYPQTQSSQPVYASNTAHSFVAQQQQPAVTAFQAGQTAPGKYTGGQSAFSSYPSHYTAHQTSKAEGFAPSYGLQRMPQPGQSVCVSVCMCVCVCVSVCVCEREREYGRMFVRERGRGGGDRERERDVCWLLNVPATC